jgi:putative ATPase
MDLTMDLFDRTPDVEERRAPPPLADRMRPRALDEFVGQAHLLGPGKVLRLAIERDEIPSMILWGPPGSGKTSLALLIARRSRARFMPFSAVVSGIKEIREVIGEAARLRRAEGRRTILFVDEIHRFNKAQQDAFLPHVEGGSIVLIGATTENPSFEVVAPLLSRARVFVLNPLGEVEVLAILERALADAERGLAALAPRVDPEALRFLAGLGSGDARVALNALELAVQSVSPRADGTRHVTLAAAQEAAQRRALLYDKAGEEHFNLISALHKSLRGSDPDAALYWLARMLAAGEDPLYVARRLVRFASEDIGNADPQALGMALAAKDAYHFLGTPEGELALAQCVLYLATAPKSNAAYVAYGEAVEDVRTRPAEPAPLHIRNAPTPLMGALGYGRGYHYAHDAPDAFVDQPFLPEGLRDRVYYRPVDRGVEAEIKRRLDAWRVRRRGAPPEERAEPSG